MSSFISGLSISNSRFDRQTPLCQDENTSFGRPCCQSGDFIRCLRNDLYFFIKNFAKGCMIKILLLLVSTRNLAKVNKELGKSIPRYGLAVGLISGVFQLVLCLMHQIKKRVRTELINKQTAYLIAGLLSGVPMGLIMNNKEQNIMKLFFFPLACRCFVNKLLENGTIPTLKKHGDILGYVIVASVIGAVQITEKYSSSPTMYGMVQQYNQLTHSELKLFHAGTLKNRIGINS